MLLSTVALVLVMKRKRGNHSQEVVEQKQKLFLCVCCCVCISFPFSKEISQNSYRINEELKLGSDRMPMVEMQVASVPFVL